VLDSTSQVGGAVYAYVYGGTNATLIGCIFNGNDGTTGHNDITRSDGTSNVTFACANGAAGAPVTMKAVISAVAPRRGKPPEPGLL
jgi:hypothetical protein